jgi:uncharacterized BrkB/YihY/UPF0761 family membrane protein
MVDQTSEELVEEPGDDDPSASDAAEVPTRTERLKRHVVHAKAVADTVRDDAVRRYERLEADREQHPTVDLLLAIRDEDERIAGREMAAAIAYRLFFLLLPMLLVVVGGLGLAGSSDRGAAQDAVQQSGMSVAVAREITKSTGDLSVFQHVLILGIGLWGTYLAGRGLVKTLTRVNRATWEVAAKKPARPFKLVAIVIGIVLAFVLMSVEWNRLRARLGAAEFLVALPVVAMIYAAIVVVMHAQLPRRDDASWAALVPGAMFVGLGIAAMQALILGYLAHKLSTSSELYGGIGTAIAALFWLYLLGRLLALAPTIDTVLWRRRHAEAPDPITDAAGAEPTDDDTTAEVDGSA